MTAGKSLKKSALAMIVLCFSSAPAVAKEVPQNSPQFAFFKSYITTIRNSVGTRTFRQLYLYDKDADRVVEVLQNGNLACAYFVSSILHHFGLLGGFLVNVDETVVAMKLQGWQTVEKPVPGSVIVWDKKCFKKSGKCHKHIGFFIKPGRAVSNSSGRKYPAIHGLRPDGRKIVEILFYPPLYEMKGREK